MNQKEQEVSKGESVIPDVATPSLSPKDKHGRFHSLKSWWIPAVIGVVALLLLCCILFICCLRKRSNRTTPEIFHHGKKKSSSLHGNAAAKQGTANENKPTPKEN
ncbi:hypothetical protein CEXT_677581 [Caerostris extrusa]|uniref:Uncharacterized protein n=1 Tax=Caerostris extrusa TaxID=172846 RepID=A0AAV4NIS5_CAEEX|nr:hypothetical protein CEXT_677581 [Caerostris extrusa]